MSRTRTGLAVVAALAAVGFAAPAAQAETEGKRFSVVIEQGTDPKEESKRLFKVPSATHVAMVATIRNHAKTQRIGSVNITPPTYVIPGSGKTTGFGIQTVTFHKDSNPGTGASVNYVGVDDPGEPGGVIQVRNAAIPAGKSLTLSMEVNTSEVVGEWLWSARSKLANDFNGDGNDFSLSPDSQTTMTTYVHSEGSSSATYDEDTDACSVGATCQVTVTYRDPDETLTLAAKGFSAESQQSRSTLDLSASQELVAELPAQGTFIAADGERDGLDDELCGSGGFLGSKTGLVDGPLTHSKEVVLTVDEPGASEVGLASLCFAGPLPTIGGTPGSPFVYEDLVDGGRASLFFPSFLPPCPQADSDPERDPSATNACMLGAGPVDGAWQYKVSVPAFIGDPVYRG